RGGDRLRGSAVTRARGGMEDGDARAFRFLDRALQRVHRDHPPAVRGKEDVALAVAAAAPAAQARAPALHQPRRGAERPDAEAAHHRELSLHALPASRWWRSAAPSSVRSIVTTSIRTFSHPRPISAEAARSKRRRLA